MCIRDRPTAPARMQRPKKQGNCFTAGRRRVDGVASPYRHLHQAPGRGSSRARYLCILSWPDSSRRPTPPRRICGEMCIRDRNHIGREDNFFDLGGHSLLVAALQQRIANSFGRRIPIIELFQNPTIRQQSELTRGHVRNVPMLPPGVHALQPKGMRNSIFWAHHLGLNLAKEMGDDQPFISCLLYTSRCV